MTDPTSPRRARLARSPAFLRGGFRPFFLGAALWAVVAPILWVGTLTGAWTLPTVADALAWHRHEMLFGFLGAAIAGFLLTAVPNWTGRLPIAGAPLAAFAGLWLAARGAMLLSATLGGMSAAVLDVGFLLTLAVLCGREVAAARNRNVPVVLVVALLAGASALDHAEMLGADVPGGLGIRAGFSLVLLLVMLIGGRVIPSFTRNWLTAQGATGDMPSQPGRFDMIAIAVAAAALLGWVLFPDAEATGAPLLLAGLLQGVRLARWSGLRTLPNPMLAFLHLAYAWVPLGLLLLGASLVTLRYPASVALHALAAGAMASMTLAIMTRASLGHTGRQPVADAATIAIFALATLGAVFRVTAIAWPDYIALLIVSAALWTGAFALFVVAYGPKLLRPRIDGRL